MNLAQICRWMLDRHPLTVPQDQAFVNFGKVKACIIGKVQEDPSSYSIVNINFAMRALHRAINESGQTLAVKIWMRDRMIESCIKDIDPMIPRLKPAESPCKPFRQRKSWYKIKEPGDA